MTIRSTPKIVRTGAVAMLAGALAVSPVTAGGLVGSRAAHTAAVQPQPSVASAESIRLEEDGTGVRLVLDLSAPVSSSVFVLADPDRAIVDLPQIDFETDPKTGASISGRRARLVKSYRFGRLAPGRSRIVLDLAGPAKVSTSATHRPDGHDRLVVAIGRTDRAAFRAAARSGAVTAAAASAPVAEPVVAATDAKPTIVLDPGHGGPDFGASVGGVIEKDVTLAFATKLAAKLEATGQFKVVLTRPNDTFIPLSERVQIARSASAALMVSIHADTLPESSDVSGATVYTVSDKASDAYAAKVAAKENDADAAVGVDGQEDKAEVNDILFDLTRQETRAYSHVFARTLVNYWKVAGRLNKNPQRAAGFVVLKAPDVPSVLLELGYLSSPTDSASLTSDAWREQATGRMAEAILSYFADRHGPEKARAGVPMALKQAVADAGANAK